MLHDHVITKPVTAGTYAVHQMLEGLTDGARPLFVDYGDRLIVRGDRNLTPGGAPVRELHDGDFVGFELRAACGSKTKGRHNYFPLRDWRSRHEWLRRKSEGRGFEVLTVTVTATRARIEKAGRTFFMDRSDFTGVLRVTDAEAFAETLRSGIGGPGKAFGYGMLLV